jgi:SAM-dependent methyltransferase
MRQTFREQARQVEDLLRRHGIEGEDAFYSIAYAYTEAYANALKVRPSRIAARGSRSFGLIGASSSVAGLLTSLALRDPDGEWLPLWYQHFVGRRFREGSGKFFTPYPVAEAMTSLAPIRHGAIIVDPACGGGTFLVASSRRWGDASCHLVGNDVEPSLADLAALVLELACPVQHRCSIGSDNLFDAGTCLEEYYGRTDLILANPPFSLRIESTPRHSQLFALGYRNSDALFLDVCHDLLRAGGRLVCLLPHSLIANAEYQSLRLAVEERWNLLGVIGLPEGVFHTTANTTTRADILIMEKDGARQARAHPTLFAFAPSVGVPLNGRKETQQANSLFEIASNPAVTQLLTAEEAPLVA